MALFHMQRFMKEEGSCSGAKELDDIIKKLHEKARAKEKQIRDLPTNSKQEQLKGKQQRPLGSSEKPVNSSEKTISDGPPKRKKKKKKKMAEQRKGQPAEIILKRLHAKAKKRERVLLDRSLHAIEDGNTRPTETSEKAVTTLPRQLPRDPVLTDEGFPAEDGQTGLQLSGDSKKRKRLEEGRPLSSGKRKAKKQIRDNACEGDQAQGDDAERQTAQPPSNPDHLTRLKQAAKAASGKVSQDASQTEVRELKGSLDDGPITSQALKAFGVREHRNLARAAKKQKRVQASQSSPRKDAKQQAQPAESSTELLPLKSKKLKRKNLVKSREVPSRTSDDLASTGKSDKMSPDNRSLKTTTFRRLLDREDDSIRKHSTSSDVTPNVDVENAERLGDLPDDGTDSTSDESVGERKNTSDDVVDSRDSNQHLQNEIASEDRELGDNVDELEGSRLVRGGETRVSSEDEDESTGRETGHRSSAEDKEREGAISADTKEGGEDAERGFALLGAERSRKKQQVTRVLPDWLARPMLIEHDLQKHSIAVAEMKQLDSRLVRSLLDDGITQLFPVQRHVIPVILDSVKLGIHAGDAGYRPRDLCVSAPTGSGKTLAFALPIVQALLGRVVPRIRALVVLPTRDLAQQVNRVFTSLCRATDLRPALIGGLKKFAQEQRMLVPTRNGETQCDIVVATPGRLVDHINKTQGFTFQYLRFMVIDEADRMMEQISQDWIAQVEKGAFADCRQAPGPMTAANCSKMNLPLQKLLFSATLSQNPEKLMQLNLFQPRLITSVVAARKGRRDNRPADDGPSEERGEFVGKYTTPVGLTEHYIQCTPGEKPLVILHLIRTLGLRHALCFANTVEATHRLYHLIQLAGGVEVAEFSSNQTAGQRRQILKQFKAGKIQLLVCSDAMARGMDIENARYVISYDMPPYVKTYIHRVGRTARAGKEGEAFSLLQQYEIPKLLKMLKHAGKTNIQRHRMNLRDADDLVTSYEKALQKLPGVLRMEQSYLH